MAIKPPDFAYALGTPAMQEYLKAQKDAQGVLESRQNRLIDPTYLAMAQGFLAPTKTGSFGESLGNVAANVGPAQAAEEKRTMDMAKMRLDMAQQGLSTEIQGKEAQAKIKAVNDALGPASPYYQTSVAQVAQPEQQDAKPAQPPPVQGGLPAPAVATPVASGLPNVPEVAQVAQVAQPAPVARPPQELPPGARQLFPATDYALTSDEKKTFGLAIAGGKSPYEARKDIDEARIKNLVTTTAGTQNLKTGVLSAPPDPTPTDVRLPDGTTHITTKTMATRLAGAQASGNVEEYFKIADQIKNGMQRPPPVSSSATAATVNAPVGRPLTKEEETARQAQTTTESTETGKGRVARTNETLDAIKIAEGTRIVAQSAKDVVNQPNSQLFMGLFEKPQINAALGTMLEGTRFIPENFRKALTSANINLGVVRNRGESTEDYKERKQEVYDNFVVASTLMAQAKFAASLLSKGQGTITDGERRLFADTTISTNMSVKSFNKISDMLIERAQFAEQLGSKLVENKMQIDDYKQTPEYKKMAREYEGRLSTILRGKASAASSTRAAPNLDAARENANNLIR